MGPNVVMHFRRKNMFNSQNQFGDIFSTFLLAGEDIVDRKGV